jgi:hypothetical protein
MIEAQALYINALIKKVKEAKSAGRSISIQPKTDVVEAYNNEIQARLNQSAFADPNCNSWYKNEAGLITNNWSDAVIPYQKRTSAIDWNDFLVAGAGAEDCTRRGKERWPRVIEETQISNMAILTGLITTAAAVTAGAMYRKSLSRSFK